MILFNIDFRGHSLAPNAGVQLGDDGVAHALDLLLLVGELLNLGEPVGIQPLDEHISLVILVSSYRPASRHRWRSSC